MIMNLYHIKGKALTLSQTTNLDSSKVKEFVGDNIKFDENSRKLSKWVKNTVGKEEIARFEQFLLFPECFQKDLYYRHVKTRACLEKG